MSLIVMLGIFLFAHAVTTVPGAASASCTTKVWAAGYNEYGQFGIGPGLIGATNATPTLVGTFEGGLVDVAAGGHHSVIATVDGAAWTAGSNVHGQLGQGDGFHRSTFTKVEGLPVVIKVAAGWKNTFFLTEGGDVYATGWNSEFLSAGGQLGLGDTDNRLSPVKVDISDVVDIAVGFDHTLFLKGDGSVFATGGNNLGQLCIGDNSDRLSPAKINSLSSVDQIAAGFYHSVLLKSDCTAWSCGWNLYGQCGVGNGRAYPNIPTQVSSLSPPVRRIAVSRHATAFLLPDGSVRSTGRNFNGELGFGLELGTDDYNRDVPGPVAIDNVSGIYGSSGDRFHFIRMDETAWGTGDNDDGPLGIGNTIDSNVPVETVALADDSVSFVSGGEFFTLFVSNVGSCSNATMTPPSTIPTALPTISRSREPTVIPSNPPTALDAPTYEPSAATTPPTFASDLSAIPSAVPVAVAAGSSSCHAKIWAAGSNEHGQFGNGVSDSEYRTATSPILLETFEEDLVDVATGGTHSIIVKADGTAWTTGSNNNGELGHGDNEGRSMFTKIDGLTDIIKAAASYENTFLLTGRGDVYAFGRLVLGDALNRLSPIQVNITDVTDMAIGTDHALFLKGDGSVFATGGNMEGQLCVGDNDWRLSPVRIDAVSDVAQVDAGASHTVFLKEDGTAWSCGWNDKGELGLGDRANRNVPFQVGGLTSPVVGVATSQHATAFLLPNGTVLSTGYNQYGELGVGDRDNRNSLVPVVISNVSNLHGSRGNRFHFLQKDGPVWGTGDNFEGGLGVGDTSDRTLPAEATALAEEGVSFVSGGGTFTLFVVGPSCSEIPSLVPFGVPSAMPSSSPTETYSAHPSAWPSQVLTSRPSSNPTFQFVSDSKATFQQELSFSSSEMGIDERNSFEGVLESLTSEYGEGRPKVTTKAAITDQVVVTSSLSRYRKRLLEASEQARVQVVYMIDYESREVDVSKYPEEFVKYMAIEVNRRDFEERLERKGIQVVPGSSSEASIFEPLTPAPTPSSSGPSTGLIIGVVVAIAVAISAAGVYFLRRRKNHSLSTALSEGQIFVPVAELVDRPNAIPGDTNATGVRATAADTPGGGSLLSEGSVASTSPTAIVGIETGGSQATIPGGRDVGFLPDASSEERRNEAERIRREKDVMARWKEEQQSSHQEKKESTSVAKGGALTEEPPPHPEVYPPTEPDVF